MANLQSYINGLGSGGAQITTLSDIQATGLKLPQNFIDLRQPGKLQLLFNSNRNSSRLYNVNRIADTGLSNIFKQRIDYKNPNEGQSSIPNTKAGYAINDAAFIRNYLGTNSGLKFIRNQIILQGFQSFDETKVYNPASPLVAAFRPAAFGALDYPVRHLDTSNVIGGLVNGLGLNKITSTLGTLTGAAPPQPSPPRSSVASRASQGLSINTLTSLVGGGDRSDEVVAPLARGDVKDLLRGNTATTAYNAPRYSKLVSSAPSSFGSSLLKAVGSFFKNNTILGGILPPTQPWNAKYRADEKTYDYYLNSGKLFDTDFSGNKSGGILSSILSSIGFGEKTDFSSAVKQRFFAKSELITNVKRNINVSRKTNSKFIIKSDTVDKTGQRIFDSLDIKSKKISPIRSGKLYGISYSDVIGVSLDNSETETSDQLFNYKKLIDKKSLKQFDDTFSDQDSLHVKKLLENFDSVNKKIGGEDQNGLLKYSINPNTFYPQQFQQSQFVGRDVGFEKLSRTNNKNNQVKNKSGVSNITYQGKFRLDETTGNKVPTRLGETQNDRFIRPTNNVDYVNALSVMDPDEFKERYSDTEKFGKYGPDIIKFYFYDILNKKYIPFNAIIKSISDNNQAAWETVEYLGRPDKLFYYKGFTREVSFNFSVIAHSVKELMPMWQRINYLVGLTRPANYTLRNEGGFMISPMVQLTMGDFYKNHNVVITSCNVTIPDETPWETIPEEKAGLGWYHGPDKGISWERSFSLLNSSIDGRKGPSDGRVAQFPRGADIQVNMNVLEKDRPKTGRSIWGDAPVNMTLKNGKMVDEPDKNQLDPDRNSFSKNIRHDSLDDVLTQPNVSINTQITPQNITA